jgi:hypothetical protein
MENTESDTECSAACDCSTADVEYVELNMSNFEDDDVSQLNEWAIAAFGAIVDITGEAAFEGLPESKQASLLRLVGEPE